MYFALACFLLGKYVHINVSIHFEIFIPATGTLATDFGFGLCSSSGPDAGAGVISVPPEI